MVIKHAVVKASFGKVNLSQFLAGFILFGIKKSLLISDFYIFLISQSLLYSCSIILQEKMVF